MVACGVWCGAEQDAGSEHRELVGGKEPGRENREELKGEESKEFKGKEEKEPYENMDAESEHKEGVGRSVEELVHPAWLVEEEEQEEMREDGSVSAVNERWMDWVASWSPEEKERVMEHWDEEQRKSELEMFG